jgi:hypothetical protein
MYGHGAAQFGGEHEVTTIIGPLDGADDEGAGQLEGNGTDYRSEGATVPMPDTEARTIEVKGAAVDAAAAAASLPVHVEHIVVKLLPASAPPPPLDPKAVAIARGLPLHVPSPAALTVWLAAAAILGVGAFAACKRMQVARQRLARAGARGGGGGRGAVVRVHALPRHKGELDLEGASVCASSSMADHSAMGFLVTSSVASMADGIASSELVCLELASESAEHERKLERQYVRRDDGELSDDEDGELSDDDEAQVGLTNMRSLLSHHKYSSFLDQAKEQDAAAKAAVVAELEDADTMPEMLFTSRVNELIKTKRLAERLTILNKNHGLD